MATYEIHSYHINVFNGDAAIHLLVEPGQKADDDDDPPKGKVKRAVLIDGGKPAAAGQIKKAIKFIGTTYDVTDQDNTKGATSLKFDGIVVTRWALDHSAGILSLIIQQLSADHPSSETPSAIKGCSLMKYHDDDTPATYFYSPYWTGVAASKLKKNKSLAPTANIKISDGKPFTFDNEKRAVDFVQASKTPWQKVCYLLASPRELIGREFFTGTASAAPTGTNPRWYADVNTMTEKAKGPYGRTGIFCIAADGVVPATTPEDSFSSITLVSPQKGVPSIALVAIVDDAVQHYFSGDSDYQVDDAAASWLSGTVPVTVPVTKLSSHGSLVSWPHKALDKFRPKHFICSTGPSSTDGLHPRWELLLLLDALVRKWLSEEDSPKDVTPFFHSTNYPVWFVGKNPESPNTGPSFDFDALKNAFSENPPDKDALALLNIFKAADSNIPKYLKSILIDAKTSTVQKTRFIIDYIRNLWVTMSYSTSEQYPVSGATTDSGVTVTPQTQLLAIVAKLSANAPTISYINGALKTVANSESPPARSIDLDPKRGAPWPLATSYAEPKDTTARRVSLAAANTAKYDVAPQGVKLPENTPAITEAKWQDMDDEVPSEDYTKLVQNLPKPEKIPANSAAISIFGEMLPNKWLVAKTAYPDLKLEPGETHVVLLGDDDSSFVGNLVPGFIGLGLSEELDPEADYWAWLMSAEMIKTTIALNMKTAESTINSVTMTCNLFDEGPLTFDTESAAAQFGSAWPSDAQKGLCTIKDTGVILVGLNTSNPMTVKLNEVVEKFRMQSTSTAPKTKLGKLLDVLNSAGKKALEISLVPKADDAAEGYRNAIWCSSSGGVYSFTLRLTWKAALASIFDKLAEYLQKYLGLDTSSEIGVVKNVLNDLTIEAQLTGRYQPTIAGGYHIVTESSFTFSTQITVKGSTLNVSFAYGNAGDMEIYVKPEGGTSILSLVGSLCNVKDSSIADSQDNIHTDLFSDVRLAYIWLAREDSQTTFGIGFVLKLGSTNSTPVGLTYSSAGIYEGALITTSRLTDSEKLLPSYDAGKDASSLIDATSPGVNITSLFGSGPSGMPSGLPDTITQASISYDHPNKTIRLIATLTRANTVKNSVPAFEIDKVTLNATKSENAPTFELSTDIKINPDAGSTLSPATLSATISYKDEQWLFKGHLESFQLGILFSHFPKGWQNAAIDLLGNINVTTLDVTYTYGAAGGASSFLITGTILLGELELRLYYQYTSGDVTDQANSSAAALVHAEKSAESKKDAIALGGKAVISKEELEKAPTGTDGNKTAWTFYAYLGASADAQNATIGSVIDSISSGLSDYLPGFVSSTPVTPADPASGDVPVMVYLEEIPDTGLFFVAHVHLGDVTLTLVQLSDKADAPTDTSGKLPTAKSGSTQPKRILRIGISKLPLIDKIPLVNQLPQPFDDLEYVWVTYPADKPDASEDRKLGFSAAEIGTINERLTAQNIPEILIKESTRKDPNSTSQPKSPDTGEKDVALAAGQHFVVIHGGKAVVDYNFSSEKKKKENVVPKTILHQQGKQIVHRDKTQDSATSDSSSDDPTRTDEPVKKGAIDSKPTKILTVQNVGLKYTDGVLWIQMDATVTLGPISFSVIGFGVGFDVMSLQGSGGLHFSTDSASAVIKKLLASVRLELHGAALSFIQPPLTLAGVFEHNNTNGDDSYAGGLAVGIPPYLLMAVGEYHEITGPPSYKSVFIFAKLDGPLITLELATIEGIRLGFGYNSFVQPPDLDNLTTFPFIADTAPGATDPMQVLQAMQQYVSPQDGTFWGAIGMKITALSLVSASAVAVVEYSPKGLDVQIYVDAVLQMPADPVGQGAKVGLLYVEITMIIELNFIEGFFRVDAALAPTSYIYVPPCHLTGGFAMCYWFNPSNYAGDYVFSIGGYHAQFKHPTYYPTPKRVGISFQLSDEVSVTGEAYFAITPKAVMGGGRLHIQFDIPLISAYFDAFADFLIMYKPFHYIADIGVDVGVSFNLDYWIVHIHISAHIGANLHIEGPEFGGTAHVDLWIHAFDIPFGSYPDPPGPLLLDGPGQFYDLLQTPGPANPSTQDQSDSDPTMNNLKISLESGAFPDANKQDNSIKAVAGTYWRVRGGNFVFRVTCIFAISNYTVNDDKDQDVRVAAKNGDPVAEDDVYANPMHISDKISSVLTVVIKPEDSKTEIACQVDSNLDLYKPLPVIKAVPKALWRKYDKANDPQCTPNPTDLLDGTNSVVKLALGLSITAPDPQLSYNTIPAFHAADAMSQNVYPETAVPDPTPTDPHHTKEVVINPALPDSAPVQTLFRPAPIDGKTDQEKWDNVQHAWRSALNLSWPVPDPSAPATTPKPNTQLQSILHQCAGVLGWGAGPALKEQAPTKLLGKGFDAFYMALPEVTGVA